MFSRGRLQSILILILTTISCSVLENRTDCPCDLFLDFSSPSCESCDALHAVVCGPDGQVECEADVLRSDYPQGLRLSVPHRDKVFVIVYPEELLAYFDAGSCRIRAGELCPELYSYNTVCNTMSDHCEAAVVICKNYSKINVEYVTNSDCDMLMELRCRFAGLDCEGNPLSGEYMAHEGIKGDAAASFRIPRQGDDSMILTIYSASGSSRNYALGNALARGGYDWTKQDLDDVTVRVDFTLMSVSVCVDSWQEEIFLPVVI